MATVDQSCHFQAGSILGRTMKIGQYTDLPKNITKKPFGGIL